MQPVSAVCLHSLHCTTVVLCSALARSATRTKQQVCSTANPLYLLTTELVAMKLFAHRGASSACPENTAAAFTNALSGDGGKRPATTGVECDMQLLRDGTIIVLHDDTLRRTADHAINAAHAALFDTPVTELSWDELRDVDVGAWKDAKWAGERMLPVAEFFALIASSNGAAALVELKGGDQAMVEPAVAAARVCAALPFSHVFNIPFIQTTEAQVLVDLHSQVALEDGGLAAESIWWISFDLQLVSAMKDSLPQTSAWHVAHVKPEQGEAKCLELIAAAQKAGIDGVDFAALPDVVTPAVFEAAKAAGIGIGVWVSSGLGRSYGASVDTPANCKLFSDRGAVFFTSDMPEDVWAWWAEEGAAAAQQGLTSPQL